MPSTSVAVAAANEVGSLAVIPGEDAAKVPYPERI